MAKWKKVAAVTTASAMTLQLAACGSEGTYVEETNDAYTTGDIIEQPEAAVEESTSEYEEAVPDSELADLEDSDYLDACADWEEQEDGSYVCDDEYSPYHGHHFFDGLMYATIGAMVASSYYQSKNKVNGTKREEDGGGSGGSGGAYRGSSSTSRGTNGATNSQTTSPGSSSATEQKKVDLSKPSNGTKSYSSGKSGFSSGGSSRGGSSSS